MQTPPEAPTFVSLAAARELSTSGNDPNADIPLSSGTTPISALAFTNSLAQQASPSPNNNNTTSTGTNNNSGGLSSSTYLSDILTPSRSPMGEARLVEGTSFGSVQPVRSSAAAITALPTPSNLPAPSPLLSSGSGGAGASATVGGTSTAFKMRTNITSPLSGKQDACEGHGASSCACVVVYLECHRPAQGEVTVMLSCRCSREQHP